MHRVVVTINEPSRVGYVVEDVRTSEAATIALWNTVVETLEAVPKLGLTGIEVSIDSHGSAIGEG